MSSDWPSLKKFSSSSEFYSYFCCLLRFSWFAKKALFRSNLSLMTSTDYSTNWFDFHFLFFLTLYQKSRPGNPQRSTEWKFSFLKTKFLSEMVNWKKWYKSNLMSLESFQTVKLDTDEYSELVDVSLSSIIIIFWLNMDQFKQTSLICSLFEQEGFWSLKNSIGLIWNQH